MRIVAGQSRGVRLKTLPGEDTRPTLERVKEGMFSAIHFILPGAKVLDLFAGSGQLGLEALSRGAKMCTFVDESQEAARVLRQNCERAGFLDSARIVRQDYREFLRRSKEQFDVVFLDPPYEKNYFPALLQEITAIAEEDGRILCESETGVLFPQQAGPLRLEKQYRYGSVLVSRYKMTRGEEV